MEFKVVNGFNPCWKNMQGYPIWGWGWGTPMETCPSHQENPEPPHSSSWSTPMYQNFQFASHDFVSLCAALFTNETYFAYILPNKGQIAIFTHISTHFLLILTPPDFVANHVPIPPPIPP